MGVAKREWVEANERGYWIPDDRFVCPNCVANHLLKILLSGESIRVDCSYCGSEMAAPIKVLLDEISEAAFSGFTDPASELPYESREGGYQGEVLESWEVIENIGHWTDEEKLHDDIADAFSDQQWCRVNHFGLSDTDRLRYGWRDFVRGIKHRTRYLFLQESGELGTDEIPPSRMLDRVGGLLSTQLKQALFGGVLYRVRVVEPGSHPTTPNELGSPPEHLALLDNRMSPAGIPMFYAAEDERTTVLETYRPELGSNRNIVISKWRPTRELILLDLTDVPALPDPFDQAKRRFASDIQFIREFIDDFTKPVDRTSSSIDYVPTQVVTEYIRRRMKTGNGASFDGIRYESSRRGGGVSVVIFAKQENCVANSGSAILPKEQTLKLISSRKLSSAEISSEWIEPDPPESFRLV